MMEDEIAARIAEIQQQQNALREERAALEKLLSDPRVEPVQVYWRYHSLRREPYDGTLEQAYRLLEYMADDGQCSPEGVEIGGVLHAMDDLRDRFDSEAAR